MAFIKRTGGIIELLILGDITAIIKGRNNEVSVFFDDSVQALDNKALTVAKMVAAEQPLNVCDAMRHSSVRTILEKNRSRKNSGSEGGYWVLGLQEDAVDHAIYQQLNGAQIEEILICTDGFASYDQLPVVMRRFCSKYEQAKDRRISIQLEIISGILEQMAKSNMLVEFMEDLSSPDA